jgi:peptidyl-dipeptidase Dcp
MNADQLSFNPLKRRIRIVRGLTFHLEHILNFRRVALTLAIGAVMAACTDNSNQPSITESGTDNSPSVQESNVIAANPFYIESDLPYGLPRFDLIQPEHFVPAFERGMSLHMSEIDAIVASTESANFENTILALEQTGRDLDRVSRVFSNLTGTHTNPELQAIQRELSPRLSAHRDAISLNENLFARVNHVYEQRDELNLAPQSKRLIERYHNDFVRSGALLSASQKDRLREINAEMAQLSTQFSQYVLAEVNDSAVLVDTADELVGFSTAQIQAAANAAAARGHDGKYLVSLLNTSNQPSLSSLSNRDLRARIHNASLIRGTRGNEYDTRTIVADTLRLRAERARLLGFETHADFILSEQTAGSAENVNRMLGDIAPVAVANARAEGQAIQAMINQTAEEPFELAPWDWSYYAEKVRAELYAFDSADVKPYFELNNVLVNGVFYVTERLLGITFTRRDDLPTYHEDATVWEAFDTDGSPLGLMLTDFYARPSKRGGAWMSSYDLPSGLAGGYPVVAMHQNISKPVAGEPTLLSFGEVTTMFHEFGHVLHGMLTNVEYPFFAGTRVPRDFVEFPSQVYEMWASWPEVLANYALHYETGAQIPQELLNKVIAAEQFNQGFATTEYIAASIVDQALHQLPLEQIPSAEELETFEQQVLAEHGLDFAAVPPRYRPAYFSHIMGGYSAGYYSYIWAEVLDADGAEWFRENGGMSRSAGQHFRDTVLARGGSEDAMQMYLDFAGRAPDINHMLRRRGLAD